MGGGCKGWPRSSRPSPREGVSCRAADDFRVFVERHAEQAVLRVEFRREEARGRVDEMHGAYGIYQIVAADVGWVAGQAGNLHDPADAVEHAPGDCHCGDGCAGPRHPGGHESAADGFAATGRRGRGKSCRGGNDQRGHYD